MCSTASSMISFLHSMVSALQVCAYAEYLSMDLQAHPELIFLAKYAMDAELPSEWNAHFNADGEEYFHNVVTGVSQYEHPLDEPFFALYCDMVAKKEAAEGALSESDISTATMRAGALQAR